MFIICDKGNYPHFLDQVPQQTVTFLELDCFKYQI